MGRVVNATPRPLYPREWPVTHCIGGWVGLRVGLAGAENLSPAGFDSRTVQPVASLYTDYAIPTPGMRPYLPNTNVDALISTVQARVWVVVAAITRWTSLPVIGEMTFIYLFIYLFIYGSCDEAAIGQIV